MMGPDVLTAGVDEAGRGPLAGPVVVAAVILDPEHPVKGLDDLKRLSEQKRNELYPLIIEWARAWSIQIVSASEIDEHNILQATLIGMRRSVLALDPQPELALVDGNRAPELPCQTRTIVQGDRLKPEISAASILAKVARDRIMCDLHEQYPSYGFNQHKGYPTREHLRILQSIGPCIAHRRSFAPVRNCLQPTLI
jgi:ribonuclease HII